MTNTPLKHVEELELVPITLSELLAKDIKPRENILDPWLPEAGLTMIYAERGVGKTHVALEIMMAIAYGAAFLTFKAKKSRKVCYADGEMPLSAIQERVALIEQRMPVNPDMIEPIILSPDMQPLSMPNLSSRAGQIAVESLLHDVDLIIVDNISTLCDSGGSENDAESWRDLQAWALHLRKQGKSVLFIHHAGKNGNQRGTSKREDVLDTVICLKHPSDYEPSMGACFELHYKKSRGIMGDNVIPLRCQLNEKGWAFQPIESSNHDRVIDLANDGLTPSEIVVEMGITKGYVSKILKKAKAEGRLNGKF